MNKPPESRLQVVLAGLRRAVDDVILRHRVTPEELFAAVDWLRRVADAGELPFTSVLFLKSALQATEGAGYAHPETDGASPWEMEGPAHLPGSPELPSPAVLPMRPDEPGEPLLVSGTVRTTTGAPLSGAVLDVWQIDADNLYSGVDTRDFLPLNIPNDSSGIPAHNLRARVVTDAGGHYAFRTVMPGVETFGFAPDSPLTALAEALRLPGVRPLHIHAIVTAEGCLPLTTQIYFDGDPLAEGTLEGPVPAATVRATVVHDAPDDYRAHGLDRPYRALTYDVVLRPARSEAPAG